MTAPQTPAAPTPGEEARRRGVEPSFDELMRRPGATVDNLGAGVDWDGARCGECRAPIPDGEQLCAECAAECPTCAGTGVTDDGDRLCPECRPVKR